MFDAISVLNGQLSNMVVKFVLISVLVVVAAIINTSTAESNETVSSAPFGYELIVASLDAINCKMQQLNSDIDNLKKTVAGIETLVTKQDERVSTLEKEITKLSETKILPKTCAEISDRRSGVYRIQPQTGVSDAFEVYCDQQYNGGGWLVIQNRYGESVNFFRNWKEYEAGFGNLLGEFWLGLAKIHELTSVKPHELLIIVEDFELTVKTARYNRFIVGGASTKYALSSLGDYSGSAGDSLSTNQTGIMFSTMDSFNGDCTFKCVDVYQGGWWYNKFVTSNLNGLYYGGPQSKERKSVLMHWSTFRGESYGLKRSRMMIRPVKNV